MTMVQNGAVWQQGGSLRRMQEGCKVRVIVCTCMTNAVCNCMHPTRYSRAVADTSLRGL